MARGNNATGLRFGSTGLVLSLDTHFIQSLPCFLDLGCLLSEVPVAILNSKNDGTMRGTSTLSTVTSRSQTNNKNQSTDGRGLQRLARCRTKLLAEVAPRS